MKSPAPLHLGPDVVALLLPHRRPFLMVDSVEAYEPGPQPTLRAARHISANEPVFDGHFPGLSLWPGVYTIEGMGQSANLLHILWTIQGRWEQKGGNFADLLAAARNLDLGFRLQPGYRAAQSAQLQEALGFDTDPHARIGMAAAVDVKLLQPVFAGQRLDYIVSQTHLIDDIVRFQVEAQVAGRTVAKGVMTSTRNIPRSPKSEAG